MHSHLSTPSQHPRTYSLTHSSTPFVAPANTQSIVRHMCRVMPCLISSHLVLSSCHLDTKERCEIYRERINEHLEALKKAQEAKERNERRSEVRTHTLAHIMTILSAHLVTHFTHILSHSLIPSHLPHPFAGARERKETSEATDGRHDSAPMLGRLPQSTSRPGGHPREERVCAQ